MAALGEQCADAIAVRHSRVPVEVPRITETTALGAAYWRVGHGFWSSREELAEKWQLENRYTPRIDQAERDRRFRRWHKAVERAKGWALDESEEPL